MDKRTREAFARSCPAARLEHVALAFAEFKAEWLDRYRLRECGDDAWDYYAKPYEGSPHYVKLEAAFGGAAARSWQKRVRSLYRAARRGRARCRTRMSRVATAKLKSRERRERHSSRAVRRSEEAHRRRVVVAECREEYERHIGTKLARGSREIADGELGTLLAETTQRRARLQMGGEDHRLELGMEKLLRQLLDSEDEDLKLEGLAVLSADALARAKKETAVHEALLRARCPFVPPGP